MQFLAANLHIQSLKPLLLAVRVVLIRGLGSVFQFGLNVLIARTLGLAGSGLFFIFVSYANLFGTSISLGFPALMLRNTARFPEMPDRLRVKLNEAIRSIVLIGSTIVLVSYVLPVSVLFSGLPTHLLILALTAGTALAVLRTSSETLKSLNRAEVALNLEFNILPLLLSVILSAALIVKAPLSTTNVFICYAFILGVIAFCATLVCYRLFGVLQASVHKLNPADKSSITNNGLKSLWGIALVNNAMTAAPYLLLPYFVSIEQIGSFGVAHRLVALSGTIIVALSSIFSPKFVKSAALDNQEDLKRNFFQSQLLSITMYLPLFGLFVFFPLPVLSIFGGEFASAANLLLILAVGRLVNACAGLSEFMLSMTGAHRLELLSAIVSLAFFLITTLLFGHSWGIIGITILYALAFVLRATLSYSLSLYRFYKSQGSQYPLVFGD